MSSKGEGGKNQQTTVIQLMLFFYIVLIQSTNNGRSQFLLSESVCESFVVIEATQDQQRQREGDGTTTMRCEPFIFNFPVSPFTIGMVMVVNVVSGAL